MIVGLLAVVANISWAVTETTLYNFTGGQDGGDPKGDLIADAAGNLYGVTVFGGTTGNGTVYEISPDGTGNWTEKVLHNFQAGIDGGTPNAGLIMDIAGNLYGTTWAGGAHGQGTVFELTPNGEGTWTNNVIYSFQGLNDGSLPAGSLIFDGAGNLYGTASATGGYGQGVVFQLKHTAQGWVQRPIHQFVSHSLDGSSPGGALAFDKLGNLYGTTVTGGLGVKGTVYKLTPVGKMWKPSIIHAFGGGTDGADPVGGVTIDARGNVYGTTTTGGSSNDGIVFQLAPTSNGGWKYTIVYTFQGGNDGASPYARVILDQRGNLYGATSTGGVNRGGVLFGIVHEAKGKWRENVIYSFSPAGNGAYGGVVRDAAGNLYGTTSFGGPAFQGMVFQVIP
ncbi:MAG TPA: choice-of-anchor tandem repeat GloVer-containing protein [Terriglobales bacterium]|nr:choice-of-anchor tandem repeat GloVer-containing protein [Terriglobales bacterium]